MLPDQPNDKQLADRFGAILAVGQNKGGDQRLAERNQVDFVLAGTGEYRQDFWRSVAELDQLLTRPRASHLFIKTVRAYPFADSNIDVVCETEKDWQRAFALAIEQGRRATYSYHEPDKVMFRLARDGREIKPAWHLHRTVSWNGVPYLENAELFTQRRQVEYADTSLPVPDAAHAIAINAGHALFENFVIPLGELYDTVELSREVSDWNPLFAAARRQGWEAGLRGYLELVRTAAERLDFPHAIPVNGGVAPMALRFPLTIPISLQLKSFFSRIGHNVRRRHWRIALRELYAYPLFYVIEKIKGSLGYG